MFYIKKEQPSWLNLTYIPPPRKIHSYKERCLIIKQSSSLWLKRKIKFDELLQRTFYIFWSSRNRKDLFLVRFVFGFLYNRAVKAEHQKIVKKFESKNPYLILIKNWSLLVDKIPFMR